MKNCSLITRILPILFFMLFIAAGYGFASDPAEGYWLSIDDRTGEISASWHIYQIDGRLCGMMIAISDPSKGGIAVKCRESYPGFPIAGNVSQMPIVGTPWIFGLTRDREGVWSNGHFIHPNNGGMYRGRITFHPPDGKRYLTDTLEMRGMIAFGIGRSQFWQRTDRQTAESLRLH